MSHYFRVIAIDFRRNPRRGRSARRRSAEGRRGSASRGPEGPAGHREILRELYEIFPDARDHFDSMVAENGAVLWNESGSRLLAAPVEVELEEALLHRGVELRRGEILLASRIQYDSVVTEEIRNLGLECQVVRNRGEIMILPAGVSRGFGTFHALGDFGISHHNAAGIGDAENDHSLLRVCDLGVAVGNAVDALKSHAEIVLEEPNGTGVLSFLRGPILRGEARIEPKRWRAEIGRDSDDRPVSVPGSQINLLITGGSKSGKSYLAGVLAERLLLLGYCVCLLDPEGDYQALESMRGVLRIGGREGLPPAHQVRRWLEFRFGSVVLDMSLLTAEERLTYSLSVLDEIEKERQATGLPHWMVVEEAHAPFGIAGRGVSARDLSTKGYCLITYRPDEIRAEVWITWTRSWRWQKDLT